MPCDFRQRNGNGSAAMIFNFLSEFKNLSFPVFFRSEANGADRTQTHTRKLKVLAFQMFMTTTSTAVNNNCAGVGFQPNTQKSPERDRCGRGESGGGRAAEGDKTMEKSKTKLLRADEQQEHALRSTCFQVADVDVDVTSPDSSQEKGERG